MKNGNESKAMKKQEIKNPHAQALGKLGGKVRSEAKTKAARKNAKKGGWPKGRPRKTKSKQPAQIAKGRK